MKSVLISIQPKWCELIASGKKTIEVRKSAPKKVPFKAYIYQTKSRDNFIYKTYKVDDIRSGKVIGEFICDKVEQYEANERGWYIYPQDDICMWTDEMAGYGNGKTLYGWHISELKIYDKPKELKEFKTRRCGQNDGCNTCLNKKWWKEDEKIGKRICDSCQKDHFIKFIKQVTRAPQSWQYVERI